MTKLVLLRHGESNSNQENRFGGWIDSDLSTKGIAEAKKAGQTLREQGYTFDIAFTSVLKRAIRTLWIVLEVMDLMWIPVYRTWQLNERHYGDLQGLDKSETAEKFGEKQVLMWRRSYDIRPPSLKITDEMYPGNDPKYKGVDEKDLPLAESLKDTLNRALPYWHETIVPEIKSGKRAIISAHGNSIRALLKYLDNISDEDIIKSNIPTGIPFVYELDENLKPIKSYYLADPEEVIKAIEAVARQGKARRI